MRSKRIIFSKAYPLFIQGASGLIFKAFMVNCSNILSSMEGIMFGGFMKGKENDGLIKI